MDGPGDCHLDHKFVSADMRLDPDRDLLPIQWYIKLHTMAARQSCCLAEQVEQRVLDSDCMNRGAMSTPTDAPGDAPTALTSGVDGQSLHSHVERNINLAHLVCRYYR